MTQCQSILTTVMPGTKVTQSYQPEMPSYHGQIERKGTRSLLCNMLKAMKYYTTPWHAWAVFLCWLCFTLLKNACLGFLLSEDILWPMVEGQGQRSDHKIVFPPFALEKTGVALLTFIYCVESFCLINEWNKYVCQAHILCSINWLNEILLNMYTVTSYTDVFDDTITSFASVTFSMVVRRFNSHVGTAPKALIHIIIMAYINSIT